MFHNKNFGISGNSVAIYRPVNWIVSYPRSGNTYLRSLLSNYAADSPQPLRLDQITSFTAGEHDEGIYMELIGKQPTDRTLVEEVQARPAYIDRIRHKTDARLPLVKSHMVHGAVEGYPTFKFVPGDRIVHLVRHPCDVVISFAHYYGLDIDAAIDRLLLNGSFFTGWPHLGYEVLGSWSQHTRSWMDLPDIPVFRTRYVDLVTNPEQILTSLVDFLGMPVDAERIGRAVEFSGFSRLKAEEQESGFNETAGTAQNGYFRDGRPGQWLEMLTIKQAQRLLDHDPELIDMLGFQKVSLT